MSTKRLDTMNSLASTSFCNCHISRLALRPTSVGYRLPRIQLPSKSLKLRASNANEVDAQTVDKEPQEETKLEERNETIQASTSSTANPALDKDLKKVVQKTAATFAPRASTATRNPAVPGTTLYTRFLPCVPETAPRTRKRLLTICFSSFLCLICMVCRYRSLLCFMGWPQKTD
ncbi:hypothetical protein Tsubulata_023832 [Turnera subulata]|uniref:Uncharacterized protein n=1 Tax=Turnera subulata TaxID=218843 RepID=A0A9Q0JIE5_9ROSI|nr:hypothetical protein Tsubulata_023832 [Turnera subulata]